MKTCLAFFLALTAFAWPFVAAEGGEFFSDEAKEVVLVLKEYLGNVYMALEEYLANLNDSCAAAVSLQKYNEVLASAAASACTADTPEGYEEAEKTISKAADVCRDVEDVDDLEYFITEMEAARTKVAALDKQLATNAELCTSTKVSSPKCEAEKKLLVGQLTAMVSHKGKATFEYLQRNAYFNTKKIVDWCMDTATKDLRFNLDKATKKISSCLGN